MYAIRSYYGNRDKRFFTSASQRFPLLSPIRRDPVTLSPTLSGEHVHNTTGLALKRSRAKRSKGREVEIQRMQGGIHEKIDVESTSIYGDPPRARVLGGRRGNGSTMEYRRKGNRAIMQRLRNATEGTTCRPTNTSVQSARNNFV